MKKSNQVDWGPLDTSLIERFSKSFSELIRNSSDERWLTDLLKEMPEAKELYRDEKYGFIILAYTEKMGQYRVPHDHGSGWVIYGVVKGKMEMANYISRIDQQGRSQLIKRESYILQQGESKVYLPSDIHHTRCKSESVLIIRFTSCDFKKEEEEGRLIRYIHS